MADFLRRLCERADGPSVSQRCCCGNRFPSIRHAGLVPGIYVFKTALTEDLNGRNKSGHDGEKALGNT